MSINLNIHETAKALNEILSEYNFKKKIFISEKKTNDFVTNIDLDLQEILFKNLISILDVPVLSEESEFVDSASPTTYWIIDPLDGTSNFIAGLLFTASSIALVHNNQIVFGFVYEYYGNNYYYAGSEMGSFKNGAAMHLDDFKILKPSLVGTSTGFIKKWRHIGDFDTFYEKNFRILGSQALQLCLVAEGILLANLSVEAKIWDDAAGILIINEAGGSYYSQPLKSNSFYGCMNAETNLYSCAVGPPKERKKLQKIMDRIS